MAERKSFNPIAAMRDSWRLTWEEQWGVMRHLALVGFGLAILLVGMAVAVGAAATSLLQGGAGPAGETGTAVFGAALGVPLAFLTVLVPAGIYRELARSSVPADIFA